MTRSVLFVVLILLWAGCCCPSRFTRPVGPTPSAEELIEQLKANYSGIASYELLTRMSYYGDQQARKGRVEILARSPASLRFEALTPSDDTVAVLVSDGERFMTHERGKAVCYTGKACAANVSRLLPVAFEGADLYGLLVGEAPLMAYDTASLGWDDCEGLWRLELRRGADETIETLWLRPVDKVLVRVRVQRGTQMLFTVSYDDWQALDGVTLARRLRLESELRDTDLQIRVREAYLNAVEGDKLFEPNCPAGTRASVLPCR